MNDSMQKAVEAAEARYEKAVLAGAAHKQAWHEALEAALPHLGELVAWAISYSLDGDRRRSVYLHNAIGDYRDLDPDATVTPLYAAPQHQAVGIAGIPTTFEGVARRKLESLLSEGYVINGVAIYHPETGKRSLIDYLGFVGWLAQPANTQKDISDAAMEPNGVCPTCFQRLHINEQPASAQAEQRGAGDMPIKDAYIRMLGNDDGWLSVKGSYFIEGYKAALATRQPSAAPFGYVVNGRIYTSENCTDWGRWVGVAVYTAAPKGVDDER